MKPRIFVTQPVAESALERMRAVAEVRVQPDTLHIVTKSELCAALRGTDILFCLLHDAIDREVIAANPKLRGIASMTITPANIDVAEATRRGIPVTVIPAPLLDDATADLAFALILSVGRRVAEADRFVRTGAELGCQSRHFESGGVSGRTLGVLGMGGVGRAAARRARAFSMRVLYHDPRRLAPAEESELGVRWVPFEEIFRESDFVSVHVGLTQKTRRLVGAREFALMKRSACLVNTARGPIVDERALIAALAEGRIAGAGLDVYDEEPLPADHPLRSLDNVVLSPHLGYVTTDNFRGFFTAIVENIIAFQNGAPIRVMPKVT